MSPAALAARAVDLLGPVRGPVFVHASQRLAAALATRVDTSPGPPGAAIVSLLNTRANPADRRRLLDALHQTLPPAAPLVLIDHNQPQHPWARLISTLTLAATTKPPSRARYPVARELLAAGFPTQRLDIAPNHRIQLVLTRRR